LGAATALDVPKTTATVTATMTLASFIPDPSWCPSSVTGTFPDKQFWHPYRQMRAKT
jgi:hypothetical protein